MHAAFQPGLSIAPCGANKPHKGRYAIERGVRAGAAAGRAQVTLTRVTIGQSADGRGVRQKPFVGTGLLYRMDFGQRDVHTTA